MLGSLDPGSWTDHWGGKKEVEQQKRKALEDSKHFHRIIELENSNNAN